MKKKVSRRVTSERIDIIIDFMWYLSGANIISAKKRLNHSLNREAQDEHESFQVIFHAFFIFYNCTNV